MIDKKQIKSWIEIHKQAFKIRDERKGMVR